MSTAAVAPEATQTPIVLDWVRALVSTAFIVAVVLGLISINLRSLVLDRDYILQGFVQNQVSLTTDLDLPDRVRVAFRRARTHPLTRPASDGESCLAADSTTQQGRRGFDPEGARPKPIIADIRKLAVLGKIR